MTGPSVEDVIAEAVGRAMVLRTSPHEIAAAAVAAVRAMTVDQQAELLDGYVEVPVLNEAMRRPVGPWRAEP